MNETTGDLAARARRAAVQRLENLERAGVTHLPKRRAKARAASSTTAAALEPEPVQIEKTAASGGRLAALDVIRREVETCMKCAELTGRTQTVFGVGNPEARICFFGEAPGADEDRQGEPFVGRAGQLLNKMIAACGLKREEVYILNTLKCRPPGNRNPEPDEVANCRGFFERQLDVIKPEVICCLGTVAAQSLLQTDTAIGRLRGSFHQWRGIPVVCTYHPAYLLRNPAAKAPTWEDLKMMMRKFGVEL